MNNYNKFTGLACENYYENSPLYDIVMTEENIKIIQEKIRETSLKNKIHPENRPIFIQKDMIKDTVIYIYNNYIRDLSSGDLYSKSFLFKKNLTLQEEKEEINKKIINIILEKVSNHIYDTYKYKNTSIWNIDQVQIPQIKLKNNDTSLNYEPRF